MDDNKDTSRWAKKFDTVAHYYARDTGTLCGSVAHCLGNNYATKDMVDCPKCVEISSQIDKND